MSDRAIRRQTAGMIMIILRCVRTGVDTVDLIYAPVKGTMSHRNRAVSLDRSMFLIFLFVGSRMISEYM